MFMSYVVQNLDWKVKGLRPSTKFVLIALCDYANKQQFTAWPSHNSIAKKTGYSKSSVQRAIKCLCDLGLLSYKNRYDEKGNKLTNMYQINLSRLKELTCLPEDVVKLTPPPSHDDQRGIVTMIDKPLKQTFNKTFKRIDLGEEVIGTNYDNRPITKERKQEICKELGFDFDKFTLKSRS
jgi:DNA-binding transcriptional MocR family regulator